MGYFDDECFLYLVGRKKEMLKVDNYQVMPGELEDIINSMQGVQSACVIGVLDEKTLNDIICAFVKKMPDQIDSISEQDILDHVNLRVINAKKIRGVFFIDSFPLTISGKIKKYELKKIAEQTFSNN